MTAHFLFHCLSLLFFYSVYWIERWILSHCHIIKSKLKTTFEENIMLTLKRCSEMDAVVTQEKCKFPNYQEYWSSEKYTFKGCPFRVTKFLLFNIKLLKHWIMVIIISARDRVLGSDTPLLLKRKKTVMKKTWTLSFVRYLVRVAF